MNKPLLIALYLVMVIASVYKAVKTDTTAISMICVGITVLCAICAIAVWRRYIKEIEDDASIFDDYDDTNASYH